MKSTRKQHPNIFLNPDGSDANPDDFSFNRHIYIARKVLKTFGTYIDHEDDQADTDAEGGMQVDVSQSRNVADEYGGLLVTAPSKGI
jgi:hypothetical protein